MQLLASKLAVLVEFLFFWGLCYPLTEFMDIAGLSNSTILSIARFLRSFSRFDYFCSSSSELRINSNYGRK